MIIFPLPKGGERIARDGEFCAAMLFGGGAICYFIKARNGAEQHRGTELTVARDALSPLGEGEYYHADLIGLPCQTAQGEPVGTCIAVENYGASDVLEIKRPDGRTFMVPMTADAVLSWSEDHIVIDAAFAADG